MIQPDYLSLLISFIVNEYHYEAVSVCVLCNDDFPFTLYQNDVKNNVASVILYKGSPDYIDKYADKDVSTRIDILTAFEKKLTLSIEEQHCESFIVFGDELIDFVPSFQKAVVHSVWPSLRNKFVFVYHQYRITFKSTLSHIFFKDQPNTLFIEFVNDTFFNLQTTKFVGSHRRNLYELVLLDTYNGETNSFQSNHNLYPDKTRDLQGLELIVAAFPYEPYSILRNSAMTNAMDVGNGNEDPTRKIFYDGTDAQILFHFCATYNCTVEVDTSETFEWGAIYSNFTGIGTYGMVFERTVDITMIAAFIWNELYYRLGLSSQTSRSGVTCLVPKPKRRTSWLLPFQPFDKLLWLGLIFCLAAETVALLVVHKLEKKNQPWLESIRFGYISALKLFISQSTNYVVKSVSVKVVLCSCYIIDIIITSVYSGGLSSILTIPEFEEAADSVERLAKHNLIWAGSTYDWVLVTNDVTDLKLQKLVDNYRVYSYEELQEKTLTGKIGFVFERMQYGHFAIPRYITQESINKYKLMKDDIFYTYTTAIVAKCWPLLDKYNNFIMMVQSSGILKYWEWMVVAQNLDEKMQKEIDASLNDNLEMVGAVKLGMENFAGIIVIWIAGIVFSIVVFFGEVFYYQQKSGGTYQ